MPATNVKTRWVGGDLYFLDKAGNEIFHVDGTNRKLVFPTGSNLDVSAATALLSLAAGEISNADIAADAAIARSKLAEDVLQPFEIPFGDVLGADGDDLAITETAGDFFRRLGTNQLYVEGEATINETEVSVGYFRFTLPQNYVDAGDIKIRAVAGVQLAGDAANGASTIDFEAYKQAADGTVGSDLVTTAATALTTTAGAKDFVVTATGLVAGDVLVVKMTGTCIESAGGTGAAAIIVTKLQMLCDVKG